MHNPFDVNNDVIFLFAFYKHRRKQILAEILKPNIEVTPSTHYLYENFLSFDSSDRAYIYARIYDFSYVRSFVNSVTNIRICVHKIYARKLAYKLL